MTKCFPAANADPCCCAQYCAVHTEQAVLCNPTSRRVHSSVMGDGGTLADLVRATPRHLHAVANTATTISSVCPNRLGSAISRLGIMLVSLGCTRWPRLPPFESSCNAVLEPQNVNHYQAGCSAKQGLSGAPCCLFPLFPTTPARFVPFLPAR